MTSTTAPATTLPNPRDHGLADDALFVGIAYAFSWFFMLVPTSSLLMIGIATFGPTVAALVVAAKHGGGRGVVTQLKRFVSFRAPVLGYLLAWYLIPAVMFFVFYAAGGNITNASPWTVFQTIVLFAPLNYTFGVVMFGTVGPHGEELGWRGHLLPRWRERFGDALAPLLVGIVWTAWHLPMFMNPEWVSQGISFAFNFATYLGFAVGTSYAMAYVSWISKNNLIVCILMHGAVNISHSMMNAYEGTLKTSPTADAWLMLVTGILAAVLAGLLWKIVERRRARAVPRM